MLIYNLKEKNAHVSLKAANVNNSIFKANVKRKKIFPHECIYALRNKYMYFEKYIFFRIYSIHFSSANENVTLKTHNIFYFSLSKSPFPPFNILLKALSCIFFHIYVESFIFSNIKLNRFLKQFRIKYY